MGRIGVHDKSAEVVNEVSFISLVIGVEVIIFNRC